MGRRKKIDQQAHVAQGIKVVWYGEGGVIKEEKYFPVSDKWRLMKAYTAVCKHIERHQWEIIEGIKFKGYMEGRKRPK